MRRPLPRIHRLLRALIACWALLVVFEPPVAVSASRELRTLSAWLLPGGARPALPLSAQAASRAGLSSPGRAAAPWAASGRGGSGARASRGSGDTAAARRVIAQRAGGQSAIAQSAIAQSVAVQRAAALSVRARRAPGVDDMLPRLDGRYLYLEIQSLLC